MKATKMRALQVVSPTVSAKRKSLVADVERAHFNYFLINQNRDTGLILDKSEPGAPASIAAVGFALTAYACAHKRRWISREHALSYALKTLTTLASTPQGDAPEGMSGYRGFFYHFLDPATGTRATAPKFWNSELSTIDTALLMAGIRFVANYFRGRSGQEKTVRRLADELYNRVEWNLAVRDKGGTQLALHGWTPEGGIIDHVYEGYSEALLLYILGMGATTFPMPAHAWKSLLASKKSKVTEAYGISYVAMPGEPLFCYQYPHAFIDFRGIMDAYARKVGFDWFENSRRMSQVHYQYAQENPRGFRGYGGYDWGLTACEGPGGGIKVVDGKTIDFRGYSERGAVTGFDDGTIAPTAAISSMPFVAELVIPTIEYWLAERPEIYSAEGFADAFNPSFYPAAEAPTKSGWVSKHRLGIDQGPIVLMLENWRSGLVWEVMRRDPHIRKGLEKAGFTGGWLEDAAGEKAPCECPPAKGRRKGRSR